MYTERRSRLGGAVVWSVTASVGGRVLPDGCMDLIWLDDDLIVAGPDTCAFVTTAASPSSCTGLRFAPGTAPAVLGIPASELLNQRVPLSAIWPEASVRPLREHIRQAPARMRAALLEQVAAERLLRAAPPEPWCAGLVAGLRAGRSVADAARQVGFSDRQLQRRSVAAFGYPPKMLARVLRMQRALDLARSGVPGAVVAAAAGYADQPHLSREIRALAGVPLGTLLAAG